MSKAHSNLIALNKKYFCRTLTFYLLLIIFLIAPLSIQIYQQLNGLGIEFNNFSFIHKNVTGNSNDKSRAFTFNANGTYRKSKYKIKYLWGPGNGNCWEGPSIQFGGKQKNLSEIEENDFIERHIKRNHVLMQYPEYNFFISGNGCVHCIVGKLCHFYIHFASNEYFNTKKISFKEIITTLEGPTIIHASTWPLPRQRHLKGAHFKVSYRVWDEGKYRIRINTDCPMYTPGEVNLTQTIAIMEINISKSRRKKITIKSKTKSTKSQTNSFYTRKNHDLRPPQTPCEEGLFGRWVNALPNESYGGSDGDGSLLNCCTSFHESYNNLYNNGSYNIESYNGGSYNDGSYNGRLFNGGSFNGGSFNDGSYKDGSYKDGSCNNGSYNEGSNDGSRFRCASLQFKPYDCAEEVSAMAFLSVLNKKRIKEISFIGDSHQRVLFQHLQFYISGNFSRIFHSDTSWTYHDSVNGNFLKLNYYWVDGIYQNGKFGCWGNSKYKNGKFSFPVFSPSSDVVILNSGSWTLQNCHRAWIAYPTYLPPFLRFYSKLPRQKKTKLVWRSIPPFPTHSLGCRRLRHNAAIAWANKVAKMEVKKWRWEVMDFWYIEAPLYEKTTFWKGKKNPHYSLPNKGGKMVGMVGEAVVRAFIHYLSNI